MKQDGEGTQDRSGRGGSGVLGVFCVLEPGGSYIVVGFIVTHYSLFYSMMFYFTIEEYK